MSEETITGPQALFEHIMGVLGIVAEATLKILRFLVPIGLGLLAWFIALVQIDQTPEVSASGGWGVLFLIFAVLTIAGFLICLFEDGPMWLANLVVSIIMWILIGLSLFYVGRSMEVPENLVLISSDTGAIYEAGQQAPRGYLRPLLTSVTVSKDYEVVLESTHNVEGSSLKVNIRRVVTLRVGVDNGSAFKRLVDNLLKKDVEDLDQHVWAYTDEFMTSFQRAAKRLPPEALAAGNTFRAPRPWMTRVEVVSVSENSELIEAAAEQTMNAQ